MVEVLAPSGNYLRALAAFKGGADAIYLGGKSFSARMGADNFSDEEIEKIISYAHSISKKVYVTINTLLFQDEFMGAVEFAKYLYSIGVDGLIVQDLGLTNYLHHILPGLVLHASTQINCHNLQQAKALKQLGFVRIVLAREAPLSFVKEVKKLGLEVEAFVHGALCVSYSGNCLLSSFIGNRSGNRGRCAQPCRMAYSMKEDGKLLKKDFYPISTKDLMTLDYLKDMVAAGVDSLKIEGRLKGEEYVYETSLAYSTMLRSILTHGKDPRLEEDKKALQDIYCRKFTKGYINEESPFQLLNQVSSSHQGEHLGYVVKASKNRLTIKCDIDVHRLDGIRFNDKRQVGMNIEKMFINSQSVEEAKKGQLIDIAGVEEAFKFNGAEVIRTNNFVLNHQIEEELKKRLVVPVSGVLNADPEKPLELSLTYAGKAVLVTGDKALTATNKGTPVERIKEQLKKSAEYPYSITELRVEGTDCFIPIASLNSLRNDAYQKLQDLLVNSSRHEVHCLDYQQEVTASPSEFSYKAIVENHQQQEIVEGEGIASYLHGDEERNVSERVEIQPSLSAQENLLSYQAVNPGEKIFIASCYCNVTNSYALDAYYSLGYQEIILSSELDIDSIHLLMEDFKQRHQHYPNVSLMGYGKLDMMIMRSCPIGTFFNNKKLHCQRCHQKDYELVDQFNASYHLIGDSSCNVRLLASSPLYLLDKEDQLKKEHISTVYLLFTDEQDSKIVSVLRKKKPSQMTRGHYLQRSL